MRLSILAKTAIVGTILPCVYFGTASATFLYNIHRTNRSSNFSSLAHSKPINSNRRYLIFSPHPDDEALGCAGIIQQALKAGASVDVVFLTNGDGFRVAVARQLREVNIGPADYIRFADLRQIEAIKADLSLGISKEHIQFLGYPDRGLMAMWNDNWEPTNPFRSPFTLKSLSPYALTYNRSSNYCGQSMLADIQSIIDKLQPTDIFVTHPSDDHVDHSAASAFVYLAAERHNLALSDNTEHATVHYFLVHRGDWPVPQGMAKTEPLVPPGEMLSLDTHWCGIPLTSRETNKKELSILKYETQTAVTKRFLVSFARSNEFYGDIPEVEVPVVANDSIVADGAIGDWKGIKPALLDPINDNLIRDFQRGGDIRSVYLCRDAKSLFIRVHTASAVSLNAEFTLKFRYFGNDLSGKSGGMRTIKVRPPSTVFPGEYHSIVSGNRLELTVPLRDLGYSKELALNIETNIAGFQIDRTGYRFVKLP